MNRLVRKPSPDEVRRYGGSDIPIRQSIYPLGNSPQNDFGADVDSDKKEKTQSRIASASVILAICSVFGIGATMVQLVLTREAIHSSNQSSFDTLSQMRVQSKTALREAIASRISSEAAKSAASTANMTLKESEASERPYIAVVPYRKSLSVYEGIPVSINLGYLNWGKTMALKLAIASTIFFGDGAANSIDRFFEVLPDKPPVTTISFVIPTPSGELPESDPVTGAPRSAYTTSTSGKIAPNAEAISFISTHEFALFIVGRIWYEDSHQSQHRTDFCFFHFLSGAIANCATHNEIK